MTQMRGELGHEIPLLSSHGVLGDCYVVPAVHNETSEVPGRARKPRLPHVALSVKAFVSIEKAVRL